MSPSHVLLPVALSLAALLVAGCASTTPEKYAARDCKIVVADFPNKPSKNVTRAEQAEAEMKMSRLAYSRGGYGIGNNLVADITRECY